MKIVDRYSVPLKNIIFNTIKPKKFVNNVNNTYIQAKFLNSLISLNSKSFSSSNLSLNPKIITNDNVVINEKFYLPYKTYGFYIDNSTNLKNIRLFYLYGLSTLVILNTPLIFLKYAILMNMSACFLGTIFYFKRKSQMSQEVKSAFLIYGKNQILLVFKDESIRIFSFLDIINSNIANNKLMIYLYDAVYTMNLDSKTSKFQAIIIDMLMINRNLLLKKIGCLPTYFRKKLKSFYSSKSTKKKMLKEYLYQVLNLNPIQKMKIINRQRICKKIVIKTNKKGNISNLENYIDQNYVLDLKTDLINGKKIENKNYDRKIIVKSAINKLKNKKRIELKNSSSVILKTKQYLFKLSEAFQNFASNILNKQKPNIEFYEKSYSTLLQDEQISSKTTDKILIESKKKYKLSMFKNEEKFKLLTNMSFYEYIKKINSLNSSEEEDAFRSIIFKKTFGRRRNKRYSNSK